MSDIIPALAHDVRAQIDELSLYSDRPLIISDADEVLLCFVQALERYLAAEGYHLHLTSFALTGNIRHQHDDTAADAATVRGLIAGFFEACVEDIEPSHGAVDGLRQLAEHSNIIILSNVPSTVRSRRAAHLEGLGLGYPVIANRGSKGAAVAHLKSRVAGPVFFIDDIPSHHSAVAADAADVHRIHYVADQRLAELIPDTVSCHLQAGSWQDITAYIEAVIAETHALPLP